MIPDEELIARWRDGRTPALEALFDRHSKSIVRFFDNKVNAAARDDLVQKTFMRCFDSLSRFRGESSFRTYLFTIARRVLCDHYRDLKRRGKREVRGLDFNSLSSTQLGQLGPSPVSAAIRRQDVRHLLEALRRVPLNYQIALELHYWEGLSASEIHKVVGWPVGTVKNRIFKAREFVATEMNRIVSSGELLVSTLDSLGAWAQRVRAQALPGGHE